MHLEHVIIPTSIHQILSFFALSNENEEVAALLLGSFENDANGHPTISKISSFSLLSRKEKKKDRVEISSLQLSTVMSLAERKGLSVIGWMHSHPKITILPSAVDLRTQLNFQNLDPRFFGLIYGSFHENQNMSMRLQLLAFQSSENGIETCNIPIHLKSQPNMIDRIPNLFDIAELYILEELMESDEAQVTFSEITNPNEGFALKHIKTPLRIMSSALRLSKIHYALVNPILHFLNEHFH